MSSIGAITREVLRRFPHRNLQYAFCYGSGAFQQTGSDMSSNVLDFVLVVNSPEQFHKENIAANGSDYSFLKHFGGKSVATIQGDGVYYNTLVPYQQRTIKYGVVSTKAFNDDLIGKCKNVMCSFAVPTKTLGDPFLSASSPLSLEPCRPLI